MISGSTKEACENLKASVSDLGRLVCLTGKVGIRQQQTLLEKWIQGENGWDQPENYEMFAAKLAEAIKDQRWIDAINYASFLWYLDWQNSLGCDFLTEGGSPEHSPTGFGV